MAGAWVRPEGVKASQLEMSRAIPARVDTMFVDCHRGRREEDRLLITTTIEFHAPLFIS